MITIFLIAFAVLFDILMVSKPSEVLGATAAYGAVLMVFMQLKYHLSPLAEADEVLWTWELRDIDVEDWRGVELDNQVISNVTCDSYS